MIAYSVRADQSQLEAAMSFFEFIGANTDDAVRVAINKTLPKVKSLSSRLIGEQVNLKPSYIDSNLIEKPATNTNLVGKLLAESRGTLLSHFQTGGDGAVVGGILFPKSPIRVSVKPGRSHSVTGAESPVAVYGKPFLFRLKNAKDGVQHGIGMFRRNSGAQGGRIQTFYGPSVSQVFKTVRKDVEPEASDIYQAELLDAMSHVLNSQSPLE